MDGVLDKEDVKIKIISVLEQSNITYGLIECGECGRICIDFSDEKAFGKSHCCDGEIVVLTSNKDVLRVYPQKILYIAIEGRKTVLYLTDKVIETNYPLDYWKNILNPKVFAQPHNSFIVNLSYVDEVNKEFVKIKHGDKCYSVYTSMRKIGNFKKALLNMNK